MTRTDAETKLLDAQRLVARAEDALAQCVRSVEFWRGYVQCKIDEAAAPPNGQ